MSNSKVLAIVAVIGLLAGTSQAIVTPGALIEFNAANNPGDASGVFTNLGSLGGELPFSTHFDPHTGVGYGGKPVLVNDGPGPLLNKSYTNVDAAGEPAIWLGNLTPFSNGEFSVEMWINRASDAKPGPGGYGNEQYIFSVNSADRSSETYWRWDGGSNEDVDIAGNAGVTDLVDFPEGLGVWRHMVITFDDAADTVGSYLDGVPGADNAVSWSMGTDWQTVTLGTMGVPSGETQPPGNRQDGSIALVRVYPFILTEGQVIDNMNSVIPEPATLCLLGLGGLALLRRRR